MASCPKCDKPMHAEGERLVCSMCEYQCVPPRKMPAYAELLAENEELKKKANQLYALKEEIERLAEHLSKLGGKV